MLAKKLKPHEVREIRAFFDEHQASRKAGRRVKYTLPEVGRMYKVTVLTIYHVGCRLSHDSVSDEPDHPREGRYPQKPTQVALYGRAARARAQAKKNDE